MDQITTSSTPPQSEQLIDDVPMFKRKRVILPMFILLVIAIAAVVYWYIQQYTTVSTDDAFIESNRATISAKISGRISSLLFDENDSIQQGDTLVRLDDADLRSQLQKAEASEILSSRSAEIATISLAKAEDDFIRAEKQYKSQVISQEQFNHAESALKLAKAQTSLAKSQIGTAQAECAIIRTQLSNTIITAPFSGVITKRWVLAGDVVSPGQAIFSMFDLKHIWVTANFEETKLHAIRPGLAVQIKIDALPDAVFNGKVLSIGDATASQFSLIPPSNASGNFTKITQRVPVKISIDSSAGNTRLLPGLSAYVRISVR